MTLNMQCALIILSGITLLGGTAGFVYDSIGRQELEIAGNRATETDNIRYMGHYLPYEERV